MQSTIRNISLALFLTSQAGIVLSQFNTTNVENKNYQSIDAIFWTNLMELEKNGNQMFYRLPEGVYIKEMTENGRVSFRFDFNSYLEELTNNDWNCGDSIATGASYYPTVSVGNQCWFSKNLKETADIDNVSYSFENDDISYPGGDSSFVETYGYLYSFNVVESSPGICPTGWKVPSVLDWVELFDYCDSAYSEGAANSLSSIAGTNPTNSSGMDFKLPGQGNAGFIDHSGYYWASDTQVSSRVDSLLIDSLVLDSGPFDSSFWSFIGLTEPLDSSYLNLDSLISITGSTDILDSLYFSFFGDSLNSTFANNQLIGFEILSGHPILYGEYVWDNIVSFTVPRSANWNFSIRCIKEEE